METSLYRNKETAAMLEQRSILLGIELYSYKNSSFCVSMQIWLLVTYERKHSYYFSHVLRSNLPTPEKNALKCILLYFSKLEFHRMRRTFPVRFQQVFIHFVR